MEDLFAKVFLQEALDAVSVVELQKLVVASDAQYSDVYCEPRPQRPPKSEVPHLGVLWEMTRVLRLLGPPKLRRAAMVELARLPKEDPARQPLLEILNELIYLSRIQPESTELLTASESVNMTELRREFEEFKASLRREGRAEGERAGENKGKADALLAVLSARGVTVPEGVRQKILACHDLAMLDRLLIQAATATSPADVLIAAA
jgi:hypothetical protein